MCEAHHENAERGERRPEGPMSEANSEAPTQPDINKKPISRLHMFNIHTPMYECECNKYCDILKKHFLIIKMETIHSQFRVDDVDENKAKAILKKYEQKHFAKYVLVKEIGEKSQKLHLQGWVTHTAKDNSYRATMSRHYASLGTHGKCFTMVKDYPCYVSYIINNDNKPDVQYDSCITNLTEEEFDKLKKFPRFLKAVSQKTKAQDWYSQLYNHIEDTCIDEDGYIRYDKLREESLKVVPRKLNPNFMMDSLRSVVLKLEYAYPSEDNCRVQQYMYDSMTQLGGDLFKTIVKKY